MSIYGTIYGNNRGDGILLHQEGRPSFVLAVGYIAAFGAESIEFEGDVLGAFGPVREFAVIHTTGSGSMLATNGMRDATRAAERYSRQHAVATIP